MWVPDIAIPTSTLTSTLTAAIAATTSTIKVLCAFHAPQNLEMDGNIRFFANIVRVKGCEFILETFASSRQEDFVFVWVFGTRSNQVL